MTPQHNMHINRADVTNKQQHNTAIVNIVTRNIAITQHNVNISCNDMMTTLQHNITQLQERQL